MEKDASPQNSHNIEEDALFGAVHDCIQPNDSISTGRFELEVEVTAAQARMEVLNLLFMMARQKENDARLA